MGKNLLEKIKNLSIIVAKNMKNEGVDKLKQEMKQLEAEMNDINKFVNDTDDTFSKCITSWNNFDTVLKALKHWHSLTLEKV